MKKRNIFIFICVVALLFHFSLIAKTATMLFEKAIYEENTLGNIDKAIEIYNEILIDPQTNDDDKAKAMTYLGMAQIKNNNKTEGLKLLNTVERTHPRLALWAKNNVPLTEDSSTTATTQYEKKPTAKSISQLYKLNPPKWPDGFKRHWKITTKAGTQTSAVSWMNKFEIKGEKYWCFEIQYSGASGGAEYTRMYVERGSFNPVLSVRQTGLAKTVIEQGEKEIKITHSFQSNQETNVVNFDKPIVFPDQVPLLVGRLPLQVGYETKITSFWTDPAMITKSIIKVTHKESVTVPAGTYDCYVIDVIGGTFSSGRKTATVWVSIKDGMSVKAAYGSPWHLKVELEKAEIEPMKISDFNSGALSLNP